MRNLSNNMQGIIWMVISCFLLTLMAAIIRHLTLSLDPFTIITLRNVFAIILLLAWLIAKEPKAFKFPTTGHIKLHLWRGILGATSMFLWVYALSVIPLAQVAAIEYTAPLFGIIMAVIFLKEKLTLCRVVVLIAGFIGAMIVIRPSTEAFHIGAIAALGAGFFYAIATLFYKKISYNEQNNAMVLYTWLAMTIFVLPFAIYFWAIPSLESIVWLIILAQISNFFFFALSYAFKKADLVVLLPFEFTSLIFAATIAFFVFGEIVDIWTISGAAIIVIATSYMVYREKKHG